MQKVLGDHKNMADIGSLHTLPTHSPSKTDKNAPGGTPIHPQG